MDAQETPDAPTLRRALRDVAALSALPAMWLNADPPRIADSLAAALIRVLHLEAVQIQLAAEGGLLLRPAGASDPDGRLGDLLRSAFPPERPVGGGGVDLPDGLRAVCLGLGLSGASRIYAVARRADFPTEAERLLLSVAANQATVALQRATAEQALLARTEDLERERREVAALNRRLAGERDRLRELFQQAPSFMAVLRGPDHVFDLCNDTYIQLAGERDFIGRSVRDVLPELEAQGFCALLDRVYATGEAHVARAAPIDVVSPADGTMRRLYLDFVYQPMFDPAGQVDGIFVQGHDVTQQTLASEHRQFLIHELNHRVKNTLATVQSIAQQTIRGAENLADARTMLSARLVALSAAHNVLTRENWQGAELREIVNEATRPLVGGSSARLSLQGPRVWLDARAALALSMATHELATNAMKHGALSAEGGSVTVRWRLEGPERFCLEWRERGGPRVRPPTRQGFGSRLLQTGLGRELGAPAQVDFHPDGVACRIEGLIRLLPEEVEPPAADDGALAVHRTNGAELAVAGGGAQVLGMIPTD